MIGYILISISIIFFIINLYLLKNIHKINKEVDKTNNDLLKKQQKIKNTISNLTTKENLLNATYKEKEEALKSLQSSITSFIETKEELSKKAFEQYAETLDHYYKIEEQEYEASKQLLKDSYTNLQEQLMREADECRKDLDKMRATRAAAIEAQRKEEEIKANISFYCLQLSQEELDDIKKLERVKLDLHKPRILSMLIWSTYFQKQLKTLSANVLGSSSIVTGIYKITNQLDNKCYIGQSVDIAKRWSQHAKAGLGIDTRPHNKLYQAMIKDGIWNFSWELLEKCPKEELDEKEKFYIDLYEAKVFGYNSTVGNK